MSTRFCALGALVLLLTSLSCGPNLENACGLSGGIPADLAANTFSASLDGEAFNESASISLGSNGSITAGLLSIIVAVDESGTAVDELIGRKAFPICVPLAERSVTTGQASFPPAFITNAQSTGTLSILDEQGGEIFGRFESELADNGGGAPVNFTEGEFRISLP